MENEHIFLRDAVDDDVLSDRKTAQAWTQVIIARSAVLRMLLQQPETAGDGVDTATGGFYAAALAGDMKPDVIEIGFRFR